MRNSPRGFGVTDIRPLLKSDTANGARMLTPSGFSTVGLAAPGRGRRQIVQCCPRGGVVPLLEVSIPSPFRGFVTCFSRFERPLQQLIARSRAGSICATHLARVYWGMRERFVGLLEWLAALGNAEGMEEWTADSVAARILAGRLRNDHA